MKACAFTDKLEVMTSSAAFHRRTGLIGDYREIEWLGFELSNYVGIFMEEDLPELLEFCEANPEYHIVTCTDPGRNVNRYIPGKKIYHLADGDKNPNLVLNWLLDEKRPLIDEDLRREVLAMLSEGKDRG